MAWSCSDRKRSNSERVRSPTKKATRTAPMMPTRKKARLSFRVRERIGLWPLSQAVAQAINGFDVAGIFWIRLKLGPQIADMHINGALIPFVGVARHAVEQIEPGEDPPRRGHQNV